MKLATINASDPMTSPTILFRRQSSPAKHVGSYDAYVVNTGDIGDSTLRYDLGLQLCPFNQVCGSRPGSVAQPNGTDSTPTFPTTFDEFAQTPTPFVPTP